VEAEPATYFRLQLLLWLYPKTPAPRPVPACSATLHDSPNMLTLVLHKIYEFNLRNGVFVKFCIPHPLKWTSLMSSTCRTEKIVLNF